MFESVELRHRVSKADFDAAEPALRLALLDAQYQLRDQCPFSVVVLINGIDGAGKGETVNLLNEWMDPRHIDAYAFDEPTSEEAERPYMWRFWRVLPPKGRIGVMFGNWYTEAIAAREERLLSQAELDQRLDDINRFEAMLVRENVLLIKLWFHLTKKDQKKRFKELESDPDTRWRVTERDWQAYKQYDRVKAVAEEVIRRTSTGEAPWLLVDGSDPRYRALFVGRALLDALQRRLHAANTPANVSGAHSGLPLPRHDARNVLSALDLSLALEKKEYRARLNKLQSRLALLTRDQAFAERSLILVFEGHDAAGKGGAIRRVSAALDARHYSVVPVGAPTDEELARPYLWRFWRHVPRLGRVVIFDRSWYGRVLVERVEGFCSEADWMRAYSEINDFEWELGRAGGVVIKFWLAIDQDEQLKRFEARAGQPHKRFKITEEDWRNREKWGVYEHAVCDMIDRTSTADAPWTLVPANNKYYARIQVLETICDRLERELKR